MGLLDFLKPKPKEPLFKGRVFDYHEDDFCKTELLPIENLTEIENDLEEIEDIQKNHSSRYGYWRIHGIKEKKISTIDRQIKRAEVEEVIQKSTLEKFDNVTTGYGSMQYDSEHSIAYGKDGCVLLYERNQNLVDHIWLRYYPSWANEEDQLNMKTCISIMCKKWNLLLVDWNEGIVINAQDETILGRYLAGELTE